MISEKIVNALNKQVNAEYYSAYLYHAMSAYADSLSFRGIANWCFVQAQEEMAHGLNIYKYILERGAQPVFEEISAPPHSFSSIDEMFQVFLSHEEEVTRSINNIATLAMQENDHACYQFIMWYVNEQVEEVSTAKGILDKINMMEGDKRLLLSLDKEFEARVFVNPFPEIMN